MNEGGASTASEEQDDASSDHRTASDAHENVLHPEEVDPLEVLDTIETSLRDIVRGARGRVLRNIDMDQPTWVERQAGERPITAASVAMASGFALGLVVRRIVPRRFR